MSPKLLPTTAKVVIRLLLANGFIETGQKGSHLKLHHPLLNITTIVPVHHHKTLPIGLLKAIEQQTGVSMPRG
jgi:mRNA interferase HicA